MYELVTLWIVTILIVLCTKYPPELVEFRKKYDDFLRKINDEPNLPKKFERLRKRILITAFNRPTWGRELGYNISKGSEISICADSDTNSMMHVLAHELAHCTVNEYEHSDTFKENMKEIKNMLTKWNLYTPVNGQKYCNGIIISD